MDPRTKSSIENLKCILDKQASLQYGLEICDVTKDPQAAEHDKILATPTLVLLSPPPARRFVGDFADAERIIGQLGLTFMTSGKY